MRGLRLLLLLMYGSMAAQNAFVGLHSNAFKFESEAGEPIISKNWEANFSGGYRIYDALYLVGSLGYTNLDKRFAWSSGVRYNFDGLGFMQADTNGDYVRISVGPVIMDGSERFSIEPTGTWWQQIRQKKRVKERLTFGINFNYWIK